MKAYSILMFTLIIAVPVFTVSVMVEYVEGSVEIKIGSRNHEARIGDSVPLEAIVRLGRDSLAEFSKGSISLILTEAGSYVVRDLLEYAKQLSGLGFDDYLIRKLTRLFRRSDEDDATTAMGIRAGEAEQEGTGTAWIDWNEGGNFLEQAEELLGEGRYEEALPLLIDAYGYTEIGNEGRCIFYIGTCFYLQGDILTALDYLSQLVPDPQEDFYNDLVVLKGSLLVESYSYSKALDWLGRYEGDVSDQENKQMVELLRGLSYQGLKDTERARNHLMKAYRIDPDSETGFMAGKIRDQL